MPEPVPPPLAVTLTALRVAHGWAQGQLATALGLRGKELSRYEKGDRPLSREKLEGLIAPMGLGPEAIDSALFWLETTDCGLAGPVGSPFALDEATRRRMARLATTAGWTALQTTLTVLIRARSSAQADRERSRAPARWRRLRRFGGKQRELLVEAAEEYRSFVLCELVCEESARAAADKPSRALELARLALFIAERAVGGELWRKRLAGYAWAFVGNALRVGNDLQVAERAFAQARELWDAGAAADPGVLDASRLLDLEASLRRAQGRFPEAVELLDQALTVSLSPRRTAHILLKQAKTYEHMGYYERAVEALERAAPRIDPEREPRQVWLHRQSLAVNLCYLERHAEAAPLAVEARALAIALRNELDLLRALWLGARVAAGLGRRAEAIAAFRQVRDDFAGQGLGYDAALATLDLAVLLLEEDRSAEVRSLATEMVPIFASLEVHREALAALRLFWQAAEQEAATAEHGRRLLRFLERARHDPELRFDSGSPDGVQPLSLSR